MEKLLIYEQTCVASPKKLRKSATIHYHKQVYAPLENLIITIGN